MTSSLLHSMMMSLVLFYAQMQFPLNYIITSFPVIIALSLCHAITSIVLHHFCYVMIFSLHFITTWLHGRDSAFRGVVTLLLE